MTSCVKCQCGQPVAKVEHARGLATWERIKAAKAELIEQGKYPSCSAIASIVDMSDEGVRRNRLRFDPEYRRELRGKGLKATGARRPKGAQKEEPLTNEEIGLRIIQAREYQRGIEQLDRVFARREPYSPTVECRPSVSGERGRAQHWRERKPEFMV